jgi:hypothetical protein
MQSALLYPPNLPFLLLPAPAAVNVSIALHAFLVGLFTHLWVARRGLRPLPSFFAGAVAMLGAPHLAHVGAGHLSNLCAMPWVPAALLAVDGLRDRGGLGWALFATASFACLLLAGNPQYALYGTLAVGLWVVATWPRSGVGGRAVGRLALAAALAGLVAAAQLWAAASEAPWGLRAERVPWAFAATYSLPPENLVTLLAPAFFGGSGGSAYWGRALLWETNLFVGAAGLVLVLRGAVDARGRAAAVVAAVLGLLALGANAPFYRALYEVVPGFDRFRGAAKLAYFAALFGSLLAGIGLDRLLGGARPAKRGIVAVAAAAAVALGSGFGVMRATAGGGFGEWMQDVRAAGVARGDAHLDAAAYEDPEFVREAGERAARSLELAAGTFAVLALLLAASRRWRRAAVGVAAVGLAELLAFAWSERVAFDPAPPLNEILRNRAAKDESDDRLFNTLAVNSAMTTQAADIWGHDPGTLRRYAELVTFGQGADPDSVEQNVRFATIPPIYAMLRLRAAVVASAGRAQLVPVGAEPLPRWLLVGKWKVAADRDAALAALGAPDFDPRTEVVLETEPVPAPSPDPPVAAVRVLGESTDRIDFEIALDRPSLLVVTDAYHPFWRAEPLPGSASARYEVLPANWTLRGIPLEAGEHRIRLEYRIPGLRAAGAVSLGAALVWLAGGVAWLLRRGRAEAA